MGFEPRVCGLNNCMVCPCPTDNKPGRLRFQRPCCKYIRMLSKDPSILEKYHEEEVSAGVSVSWTYWVQHAAEHSQQQESSFSAHVMNGRDHSSAGGRNSEDKCPNGI